MPNLFFLGEILLRLETERNKPTVDKLDVYLAGAAYNSAMGTSNLGNKSTPISVVPNNFWGDQIKRATLANGADASKLVYAEGNQGIYFLERGYGKNQSSVAYNRKHSVFADEAKLLENIEFGKAGDILHLTGISLLVSDETYKATIKVVEKAKAKGMQISFDFNYRSKLGSYEVAKPRYEKLLSFADYIFATKRDFVFVFGWDMANASEREIFDKVFAENKDLKLIVHTNRSNHGSFSGLQSVLHTPKEEFSSKVQEFTMIERIGGGDGFVTGVLDGIVNGYKPQELITRANAYAILKQSTKGDFAPISKEQLDNFVHNFNAEVSR